MKKLLTIITVLWFPMMLLMTSCQESETTGEADMISKKFEHEGHHYIFFYTTTTTHAGGVTLDPDYMFQGDTITYEGNKYIKVK